MKKRIIALEVGRVECAWCGLRSILRTDGTTVVVEVVLVAASPYPELVLPLTKGLNQSPTTSQVVQLHIKYAMVLLPQRHKSLHPHQQTGDY